MTVHVRLFAGFRETVGESCLDVPSGDAATVGDLWALLLARYPGLAGWAMSAAVNQTVAPLDTPLADGDEVAFLPPVGGG